MRYLYSGLLSGLLSLSLMGVDTAEKVVVLHDLNKKRIQDLQSSISNEVLKATAVRYCCYSAVLAGAAAGAYYQLRSWLSNDVPVQPLPDNVIDSFSKLPKEQQEALIKFLLSNVSPNTWFAYFKQKSIFALSSAGISFLSGLFFQCAHPILKPVLSKVYRGIDSFFETGNLKIYLRKQKNIKSIFAVIYEQLKNNSKTTSPKDLRPHSLFISNNILLEQVEAVLAFMHYKAKKLDKIDSITAKDIIEPLEQIFSELPKKIEAIFMQKAVLEPEEFYKELAKYYLKAQALLDNCIKNFMILEGEDLTYKPSDES